MHTIQSAAERTGLTPDVIRIWERRYQAVSPNRTAANQRLYSDAEIARLSLLKQITDIGRRISAVANLSDEELRLILSSTRPPPLAAPAPMDSAELMEQAVDAILQLDPYTLEFLMERAMVGMGSVGFMMHFAAPLMNTVGQMWRAGSVRTCQEHFASAHMRSYLGRYMIDANTDPDGPRVVVATLPGQSHELGATMAGVVAAQGGWNVIYLGPSVPVEEIAFCADCKDARAVAISLSYPMDDPRVPPLLPALKQRLPAACHLLIGGASAHRHRQLISNIGAWEAEDLAALALRFDELR